MEAQQCAREPTGTNWPTLHETTKTQQPLKDCLQPLYKSHSTHTPQHTKKGGSGTTQASDHICGGHSSGETPGNIPNPEAKPTNANGTAPDRVWESRTPPQHNSNKPPLGPPLQEGVYHCAQTQSAKPKTVCTLTLNSTYSPTGTCQGAHCCTCPSKKAVLMRLFCNRAFPSVRCVGPCISRIAVIVSSESSLYTAQPSRLP